MKIKLAILEEDTSYLGRFASAFENSYPNKVEIYSFTDQKVALSELNSLRIDVLIANDTFDINVADLPNRCGFAYFVASSGITAVKGQRAICKFQKHEQIYREILGLYAETANNITGTRLDDDTKTKVVIFASPCGGVGTSTMAAACAMHFAAQGKRTLYLNLEKFGSSDVFFSAGGNFCMGDVIFALKSKRTNFSLRLESCVKQDSNGVFFYSQSKNALEMFELSNEEMKRLISELKSTGSYDYIVIDTDIAMDTEGLEIYRLAHSFVWVGDGSEISNSKIRRAYSALSIRDEDSDSPLINRICLVYNMFSNKTGIGVNDLGLRNIGGAPRYTHASTKEILAQLVSKDIFDKIF